jgi:hypothetical protein
VIHVHVAMGAAVGASVELGEPGADVAGPDPDRVAFLLERESALVPDDVAVTSMMLLAGVLSLPLIGHSNSRLAVSDKDS